MPIFPFSTTYNLNDLIPQDWRDWDDYFSRLNRYDIFAGYYHNIAYHTIVNYSQALKVTERLYKHVRGVYNPAKRLVEGYVSKIYGGMLDTETGTAGAIPLQTEDEALRDAITRLWQMSRWGQQKSLYVRYGAMIGDAFIKVVDDIQRQQVRLEVVDPAKVKALEKNDAGEIEYVEFEYYIRNAQGRQQKYNETITPDRFSVTLDGKPAPMFMNGRNEQIAQWDNPYGFVPLVHVQHMDMGLKYGAPAIYGSMHKINELNDLASILNDGMRKQVQLPLVFKNAEVGTIDLGSDQSTNTTNPTDKPRKDTVPALQIKGQNADVITLSPTIDISAGMQNVVRVSQELEMDLPELALHRLREAGQLTAPGVRSAYDDAIARYQEARGNYDTGLVDAQKIAVAIAGMRGYDGFGGYNLTSLDDGRLEHQIAMRPVISDTLGLNEKINLTLQAIGAGAPETVFTEMGWSTEQAQALVASGESIRQQSLISNPFGQLSETPPPDDSEATPQDAFDVRENGGVNEADLVGAVDLLQTA